MPIISFNLDPKEVLNPSLRIAAREDRLDDLRELVKAGEADVDSQSDSGMTALMYASRNCFSDVASYLVRKGADVNLQDKAGRTALMYASRALCLPVVKRLLGHKATRVDLRDRQGRNALDFARSATALEVDGAPIEMLRLLQYRFRASGP